MTIGTAHIAAVGAGVAGSATAMAAAKAGRDVVLINGAVRRRLEHGETLPPEARQSLRDLGLADRFAALLGRPCWANRSVWGSARLHTWVEAGGTPLPPRNAG